MLFVHPLPCQEKALKVRNRNRLNLRSQAVDCETMNPREEAAVTPFQLLRVFMKSAAQDEPLCFQAEQCSINLGLSQLKEARQQRRCNRANNFHAPTHQLPYSIGTLPFPFQC